MISQDVLVCLEQIAIADLIQFPLVRPIDELHSTFTEPRRAIWAFVLGSGPIVLSLSIANQIFQAHLDVLQTLVDCRIRSSLTKTWVIMLLEKSFKSVNGVLQLLDDLYKIDCSKAIWVVDHLSKLWKLQFLKVLDSRFKRLETWLVGFNLSRRRVRVNVEINQRPISATDLGRIFGNVVEGLTNADWLHLAQDKALFDLDWAVTVGIKWSACM